MKQFYNEIPQVQGENAGELTEAQALAIMEQGLNKAKREIVDGHAVQQETSAEAA